MLHTKVLVIASLVSTLGLACVPPVIGTSSSTSTTNARVSAASAAPASATPADPELAQLVAQGDADPILSAVTNAVVRHDDARAIALSNADTITDVPPEQRSPWLDYNRAVALARVGRSDDAIASYDSAEKRFESRDEIRGLSLAIYGKARTLADAHRCAEARRAYGEYASVVRATHPEDATMALTYASACHGR